MNVSIPIRILKLDEGFHLAVNICINDKPAWMLIDTGASKTVLDKERAKNFLQKEKFQEHDNLSIGLGTSNMKSHLVTIKKISFGKIENRNYTTVVLDLSNVNDAYRKIKQKPIDGILGSDLLKKYKAVIDYGKKIIILRY